ncbi:MAG: carbohydrate kinase family protein [Candidatus Methanosuratincola petrocarbonis]
MEGKVASVGNINVDLAFYMSGFPQRDSESLAEGFKLSHGGSAANFAVGIARLGIPCSVVGCVGRDVFGMQALDSLNREGVGTRSVLECDLGTGTVCVLVEGGRRTMVAWRGANEMIVEAVRRTDFSGYRLIHIANVRKIVFQEVVAKKGEAMFSFDPGGGAREFSHRDLAGVDFLLLNEEELGFIGGLQAVLREVGTVVVKQGARGASYYSKVKEAHCPAFRAEAVDATGAGDAFDAGFIAAVLRETGAEEALRWGCGAAALKIGKRGAREGLPTAKELAEFLDKNA